MREIINISLPKTMAREIKNEVKKGNFASTSEFIRHIIRFYNTEKLARKLNKGRNIFEAGKRKELKSLENLM